MVPKLKCTAILKKNGGPLKILVKRNWNVTLKKEGNFK